MAADSRITFNMERTNGGTTIQHVAVGISDANRKLFRTAAGIGISVYGAAAVGGIPIAGYIDSFLEQIDSEKKPPAPHAVAHKLNEYFQEFESVPETQFHVAGYHTGTAPPDPQVWHVDLKHNSVQQKNPEDKQGATWGGEADIITRLLAPVATLASPGVIQSELPYQRIPFEFFTLQDAIDFSIFAVRSTIEAIRFMPRPKTVGGPIDILAITPKDSRWIQHKELHA
ncbi:hypothetical protein Spiaf_1776 [Spirochaeta africana DSM 8902]|uniref:Uncharacterized protein n=2 Tax=Spirochaeta TaxID=146 RepID=H9UJZ0_SPIAZ|nr:hypothetical protein Spiaf_1776 [Spirochaeta africana DSM 8902]